MDLKRIHAIAFAAMGEAPAESWREKGNKFYHGERTAKLALSLRERIFPEQKAWDEVLTAAALFHDIKNGRGVAVEAHAAEGARETAKLLKGVCEEAALTEICDLIARHNDRKGEALPEPLKLLQDADHLDHFGSYDVWRSMLQAVHRGLTYPEMAEKAAKDAGGDARFLAELHFAESRRIYLDKMRFFREFSKRLHAESRGEIYESSIDGQF